MASKSERKTVVAHRISTRSLAACAATWMLLSSVQLWAVDSATKQREYLLTPDDEREIQRECERIQILWEAACLQVAKAAAQRHDVDRAIRLLSALAAKPNVELHYRFAALCAKYEVAARAKRYGEAAKVLEEMKRRPEFASTENVPGIRGPVQVAVRGRYWWSLIDLLERQGKLQDAIQACHDAGPAIRRSIAACRLSQDYTVEFETGLQIDLREKEAALYEKAADYQHALSTLRDAIEYGKRPGVWNFEKARRVRQNWEKRSRELVRRYQAGAAAQRYLVAWRDKKYDVMYGLLSERERARIGEAEFIQKMRELQAAGGELVGFENLHVEAVTPETARATAKLIFSKDVSGGASSGKNEILLTKTDHGWFIEAVRSKRTRDE